MIMKYLNWDIVFDPKPIPDRNHDFEAVHTNYDGVDGGNGLAVTGINLESVISQINEIEEK